jgi:hypothetical protein
LKKPTGSVRFQFYKPKTEKTKPDPNQKKPSQNQKKPSRTGLNQFFPKKQNRTETGRFEPVSFRFWFFFKSVLLLFIIKTEPNQTEPKIITYN